MKLQILNNGYIAYPSNESDFEVLQRLQFIQISTGGYIPKMLFKYYSGYEEIDGKQVYHHKFSYLKKEGLVYDMFKFKLAKGKMNYRDGFYDFDTLTNNFSPLQFVEDAYDFPLEEKNKPLHLELMEFMNTQGSINTSKNDYDYDALSLFRGLFNKVNEIVLTLKTAPAVVGSPLNPLIEVVDPSLLMDVEASASASSQIVDLGEETIEDLIKAIKGK